MRFNTYRQAIETLHSREAAPSFEEIRTLVLYEKRSRRLLPIPFWLIASACAPLLVALSILFFPELFGLKRVVDSQSSMVDSRPSSIFNRQSSSSMINNNNKNNNNIQTYVLHYESRSTNHESRITSREPQITPANPETIENQKNITDKTQQKEIPPPAKSTNAKGTESQASPIHPVSEQQENLVATHRMFAFLSSGLPLRQASIPYQQLLPFSAGIRYQATQASSVLLELHKNVFLQKYTANKISFHDTNLSLNGQTYRSTIGELYPVPVQAANTYYSINAGYRFSLGIGAFNPFAEVFLGASFYGGLLSEAAGIEYSFNSPISFELGVRSDQLYSPSASPLSAFTISAGINYMW